MDCDICCEPFDNREREPKILARCGHTVCDGCIQSIRRTTSAGDDIVCPHCRVVTRFEEIRSNFAIRSLLEQPIISKKPDRPSCMTHPTHQVSVFCVPCRQFVCHDCFETVDSFHSTHARISFNDGINKIQEELEGFTESCDRIKERNIKDLEQLHMLHQELSRLNDVCVGHYNRVLEFFKAQLVQVQVRLNESDTRLQAQSAVAVDKLNTAKAIEQLVTRIKNDVPTHLVDYMRNRNGITECIKSMSSEVHSLEEDLNQVSISSTKSSGMSQHQDIPRVSLSFPDSYQIFKLEGNIAQERDHHHHKRIKHRTLHRKTSNDELNE